MTGRAKAPSRQFPLLLVAVLMMGLGGLQIWQGDSRPIWSILLRCGMVLALVWMAWPEMVRFRFHRSWPALLGSVVFALTLVLRPKLVPWILAGLVVAWVGNWILRRLVRAFHDPSAGR